MLLIIYNAEGKSCPDGLEPCRVLSALLVQANVMGNVKYSVTPRTTESRYAKATRKLHFLYGHLNLILRCPEIRLSSTYFQGTH